MTNLTKEEKQENVAFASLCIWEWMLEKRNELPALRSLWYRHGTVEMRCKAIALAPQVEATWATMKEDEKELLSPYDWEFVPHYLSTVVDWHQGAAIGSGPRQCAETILRARRGW